MSSLKPSVASLKASKERQATLSVFFDPSLPLAENLSSDLAVSTGDCQNVSAFVVADHNQAKTAIDRLHGSEVNSYGSQWVLHQNAVSVNAYGWAPKHQPSCEAEQNQNGNHAEAQAGYNSINCDCGCGKNPHHDSRELIRSRPEFIRRHLVILTDKVQVCA